jgi:DNA-binding response OmpR family regulator
MSRVLIADDEKDIRDLVAYNLQQEGYSVSQAADGVEALDLLKLAVQGKEQIDLLVLDVMMPRMDGYEVLRKIRADESTRHLPIIMLTARESEVDEILGLEMGSDDYIQKPVSPRVLLSRIKSLLRRTATRESGTEEVEKLKIEGIEIDRSSYKVFVDGSEVFFPRKEFELLYFFLSNPGRAVSRDALLQKIWGDGSFVVERTVDVHVFKIREKLGKYGERIETVKGIGYRFKK